MINYIKKFVFIHIPKTAGTTIKSYLTDIRGNVQTIQHPHILDYMNTIDEIDNFFKFTCVRNPYDLIVSRFFYRKKIIDNIKKNKKLNESEKNKLKDVSFDEFVKNKKIYLDSFKGWVHPKSVAYKLYDKGRSQGSQFDLISNENQVMLMDKIIKYENIGEELKSILRSLEIFREIEIHLNKTEHTNYRDYYTSETKKIIKTRFEKDLDYFKYTF